MIFGTGPQTHQPAPEVRELLRQLKISFECMPTQTACGQFNLLNEERRRVAACIVRMSSDEHARYIEDSAARFQRKKVSSFKTPS